jgi:tripartite-type tricarboxylate transporter receptor subunit TctC
MLKCHSPWSLALLMLALGSSAPAVAQSYPTKTIKLVVPFGPGGPTDLAARIVAQVVQTGLGQNVVIENRPGAGGATGTKSLASADPDGYTALLATSATLGVVPALVKNPGYDPIKSFAPVAKISDSTTVLVVPPAFPANSVAELVTYAKANPGKIVFGSQGYGTAPHLLTEMLKLETGVNIVHVPYRGTNPAITDLLAGQIQMFTDTSTVVIPQIQAGKLRALAVTTPARSERLADVPTTAEAGFPKLKAYFWLGVVAPARTAADIVGKLNAAFNDSLRAPETRARLESLGAEIKTGTPQEFGTMLKDELAMWQGVTAAAGIKVD